MKKYILILFLFPFISNAQWSIQSYQFNVLNDGKVGIGTTTPTSRLHVFGNGTGSNLFNVTNDKDDTKDSSVVIDAIGNVGIGKTPYNKLDVNGFVNIDSSLAVDYNIYLLGLLSKISFNRGGYISAPGANCKFTAMGIDIDTAQHFAIHYNRVLSSDNDTTISLGNFHLNLDNYTGNVGIGTTTPTSKLEVVDGTNTYLGSAPLAIARTTTNDKIAFIGSAVTNLSETLPAYNIGLYGTASGGTNNFAGYFNLGNVYVNQNLGIGTKTPAAALHIKDGIERLGVVTYSTLDSTHLSTQDVRCTDTIKTSGTFYYNNAGSILSINTAYGIKVYGFSTIDKDSLLIQDFGTTLSDNEAYSLPTNLSWKGEIDVDSLGYTLFTAQIRCDANGTPYLEGVSWKRWSSKTYVEVGSTDGYLNITDGGSGMVITNTLGYTIKATLRFRTKQ